MSEIKDQSLDDTLKEILEGTKDKPAEKIETSVEKPKRKRRTKAQIEADKKAEEAKKVEETASIEPANVVDEPEVQEFSPEVIPDTAEDSIEDVTDALENLQEDPTEPETLQPEVIPDNEADAEPDVVEEKEPTKVRPKPAPGEVFEALKAKKDIKPVSKYIGKSCVVFNPTPTYRAPHVSMRMKPYRGFITVLEDPKGDFIKVQFLRQGFGLCAAYMDAKTIISLIGGDEDGTIQEE